MTFAYAHVVRDSDPTFALAFAVGDRLACVRANLTFLRSKNVAMFCVAKLDSCSRASNVFIRRWRRENKKPNG